MRLHVILCRTQKCSYIEYILKSILLARFALQFECLTNRKVYNTLRATQQATMMDHFLQSGLSIYLDAFKHSPIIDLPFVWAKCFQYFYFCSYTAQIVWYYN